GALSPNEPMSCAASYTITAADLIAGSVTNKATAHGLQGTTPVDSNEAAQTVTALRPSLAITKSADSVSVLAGSAIGFTMTLTNGGPGSAVNVTLTDQLPAGSGFTWVESPDNSACGISGGTL